MSSVRLPRGFRKLSAPARREAFADALGLDASDRAADAAFADLADVMVESSVGIMPVPLGIATDFVIDEEKVSVPLATEEPSVVAAANYAAHVVARAGGFRTSADPPVMTAQVFLEGTTADTPSTLYAHRSQLEAVAQDGLERMEARGGGFRALRVEALSDPGLCKLEVDVDVRNAMGANLLNTLAERLRGEAERVSGATGLMAILTNAARSRRARAEFSIPVSRLARAGYSGEDAARRIVRAARVAELDRGRAVTHNKGLMNGVTALALATANDTRAIEAAVHAWASRSGSYRSLTEYRIEDETLHARVELPLAFATVGGAVSFHPSAQRALRLLGSPDAPRLSRIAAAVGLAQNFAAVYALVTEGIQHGHMRLHAARVAYKAGARGEEVRRVGDAMWQSGEIHEEAARRILEDAP